MTRGYSKNLAPMRGILGVPGTVYEYTGLFAGMPRDQLEEGVGVV